MQGHRRRAAREVWGEGHWGGEEIDPKGAASAFIFIHLCMPSHAVKSKPAQLSSVIYRRPLSSAPLSLLTPPTSPLRPLPNGNIEVGVHIADVTHFLKPDTAMDAEAALRGTTVYLVQVRYRGSTVNVLHINICAHYIIGIGAIADCHPKSEASISVSHCSHSTNPKPQRRLDMLPKPLTEDICSLRYICCKVPTAFCDSRPYGLKLIQ